MVSLVDGHGVALEPQLGLDELAVGLAQGGGRRNDSRWPGWGSLSRGRSLRAGGHPGAVCGLGGKALLVGTDGMAGDARDPFDLTLAGIGLQQRLYGGLQVWLQDVHSNGPLGDEGDESNVLPVGQWATDTPDSMRQITPARWSSLGGHKWSTLSGLRGVHA